MNNAISADEDGRIFPWEDVRAARKDSELQTAHALDEAMEEYTEAARSCPGCGTPPAYLIWFYFESPASTWENLCGRAGWMTVCEWCELQVDFFLEAMN